MDYNAYRKRLDSESYKKFILPSEVERLTSRFLQETAPLFVQSSGKEGGNNESWGQNDEELDAERFRRDLIKRFWEECLKLKAKVVLNIEKFSFIWPTSAVFDKETMSAGYHRAGERAPAVKDVRFCVWPGLVSYYPIQQKENTSSWNWRLALVDKKKFLRGSRVENRGEKELLVRSFVV
jgi:hypothetical protein